MVILVIFRTWYLSLIEEKNNKINLINYPTNIHIKEICYWINNIFAESIKIILKQYAIELYDYI